MGREESASDKHVYTQPYTPSSVFKCSGTGSLGLHPPPAFRSFSSAFARFFSRRSHRRSTDALQVGLAGELVGGLAGGLAGGLRGPAAGPRGLAGSVRGAAHGKQRTLCSAAQGKPHTSGVEQY